MTLMTKNRTNKNRGERKHGDDKFEIKMQDSLIGSYTPLSQRNDLKKKGTFMSIWAKTAQNTRERVEAHPE